MAASTAVLQVLVFATCALEAFGKKLTPCPKGCMCVGKSRDFGDCKVTVSCEKLAAYPAASEYPADLDCLFMGGAKLPSLSDEDKEAGLRAFPTSLRRLDLSACGLGQLAFDDALGRLTQLRVLNLEFNQLTHLPKRAFHGLSKLKVLWLTGNHYQPDEKDYKKMQKLGNNLQTIDPDQFQGLHNLQVLLMHHNKLTELPESIFADQTKLKVLKLLDNPFKPKLTRNHEAFKKLLASKVLYQLDINQDSGDDLEDYWEKSQTYLSDEYFPGKPKKKKNKKNKREEL